MGWLYLVLAIVAEVVATSSLKLSEGFTKPVPSLIVVVGYGMAFWLLGLVLKTVPISVAYAVWSGVGIVLLTVVGALFFRQNLDLWGCIGIALITSGVLILNLLSSSGYH